jgi:hypothetical protein
MNQKRNALFHAIILMTLFSVQLAHAESDECNTALQYDDRLKNVCVGYDCNSAFQNNQEFKNICVGFAYGKEPFDCSQLTEPDQQMACYTIQFINDGTNDCKDLKAFPYVKESPDWMVDLCLQKRNLKTVRTEEDLDMILLEYSLGYFFGWHSLPEPKLPLPAKRESGSIENRNIGKQLNVQAQKWLDVGKEPLSPYLENTRLSRLAQDTGFNRLIHGVREKEGSATNLLSILKTGSLLSTGRRAGTSPSVDGSFGQSDQVFLSGIAVGEEVKSRYGKTILVFDTHLLDRYPDFHVSNYHAFGAFKIESADSSDKRRLYSYFQRVGKGGYENEFVFKDEISLDDVIEIYLPKASFKELESELRNDPHTLGKYRSKFRIHDTSDAVHW